MEERGEGQDWAQPPTPWGPPPVRRRGARRWLLIGGGTAALTLLLGASAVYGSAAMASHAGPTTGYVANADYAAASGCGHRDGQGTPGSATPSGQSASRQDGAWALEAALQRPAPGGPGGHDPRGGWCALTVSGVSGGTITAKTPSGTSVTIKTTSTTKYTKAGQTVSSTAVAAGATIRVRGAHNSDGSITATSVEIVLPTYSGQVTAVSGNSITVKNRQGTQTIHTSGGTKYTLDGKAAGAGDVKVGDRVTAMGTVNGDKSLQAQSVVIAPESAGGQITKISGAAGGATITVQDRRGTTTIHVTGATKYDQVTRGSNGSTTSAATFADLKVGSRIWAEGTQNGDGSLSATVVHLLPAPPAGGAPDQDQDASH
jgi:hypothetical protein